MSRTLVSELELPQLKVLQRSLTPKMTKYIPHEPFPKQSAFLLLPHREAFYGGSAGGGKSDALLMAALQYVDEPNYSAILFRRTYSELSLAGALMFRAKEWLAPYTNSGEVHWNEKDKVFTFPSGATVAFGYLETNKDKFRYQSAEFQFIGFDELTHFRKDHYTYLFNRLRRLKGSKVPLRMRAASNPGNIGHDWVKNRFLAPEVREMEDRAFIPATLEDNKYIDREEYIKSLQELDPITRAQLLEGDWDIKNEGNMFKRQWFEIVDQAPREANRVRYWDLAATEAEPGKDPDWTVGVLLAEYDGVYYVEDVVRVQENPGGVERVIKQTAMMDGKGVPIFMEQEPGSSGKNTIDHYARHVLKGYSFQGDKVTGSKIIRANPVSAAASNHNMKLVKGAWNKAYLEEVQLFPQGKYKDQVDATSGAFNKVHESSSVRVDPNAMAVLRGARLYG